MKVISFDNNHSCQFVELRNIEFLPGYTKDDFADDFYWRGKCKIIASYR